MSRAAGNWLAAYSIYTAESEAPETYHMWTGLSIMASVVRRNIFLDQGIYLLFPNLFVILVAPPGKIGKSTVIRLGRKLLHPVEGVTLGPDSITREELIRVMAKTDINGQSAVTIHSSELSSLIEPSGLKMIQFLTDIYDCDYDNPTGWRYDTKGQGKDVVINPVLNLLAGTTPTWIAEGLPAGATDHGFTSRTIFVYEDEPRFDNPFPKRPNQEVKAALIEDLQHLSKLEGKFTWGKGAKEAYKEHYSQIRQDIPLDPRIEGYWHRKRTHLLKVAMLLSLSETDEMELSARDIDAAADLLTMVESQMPKTFSALGKYEFTSDLERILHQIRLAGGMANDAVHRHHYHLGSDNVKDILQSLYQQGVIERKNDGKGNTVWAPTDVQRPVDEAKERGEHLRLVREADRNDEPAPPGRDSPAESS